MSEEIEGLRFAPATTSTVLARKAPELDQPRLVFVQLQAEAGEPFGYFALEALRVPDVLEPCNPIVGIPHRRAYGLRDEEYLRLKLRARQQALI